MAPPPLSIHPPLLNSASPWATTAAHLRALLMCQSTGAVTVRTSLLAGFDHQPSLHRFVFFDPATTRPGGGGTHSLPDTAAATKAEEGAGSSGAGAAELVKPSCRPGMDREEDSASLNNLGYSPIPLEEYLDVLRTLAADDDVPRKTVILSVTGTPPDISACYEAIATTAAAAAATAAAATSTSRTSGSSTSVLTDAISTTTPPPMFPLAMEVNLSCPNIPGSPPPAYDAAALEAYLSALPASPSIPIGFKTPPYTHSGQYDTLKSALRADGGGGGGKLSFITATNTLGSCLVLQDGGGGGGGGGRGGPVLPGTSGGIGGMAGPPLHPLALGNVATIRKMLDGEPALAHISIIGVGGVSDGQTYRNMRSVGASAVALATALGKDGPAVFWRIEKEIDGAW